jgi:Mg2+/Co2+ transporter CorB
MKLKPIWNSSLPQLSFSTEITAIMTWESSFDDMVTLMRIQDLQRAFSDNDSQFHSHMFMEESITTVFSVPKEGATMNAEKDTLILCE